MLTNANTGRMIHTISQNAHLMAKGVLPEVVGTSQNLEASRLFLRASQPTSSQNPSGQQDIEQGSSTPNDKVNTEVKPIKRIIETKRED